MLYTFLLVVHAIIAAALVAVILVQRSEGGGLGVGGSPSGLMSARGAADFLTRSTAILAALFVLMSIGLAALATVERRPSEIDTSLARRPAPTAPANNVPLADPLAGAGAPVAAPAAEGVPTAPAVTTKLPEISAVAPAESKTDAAEASRTSNRSEARARDRAAADRSETSERPRERRRRDNGGANGSSEGASGAPAASATTPTPSSSAAPSAPSNVPAANDTPPPAQ